MFDNQDFKNSYIIGLDGFTYSKLESAFSSFFSKGYNNKSHVVIEGIEKYQLSKNEALHILAYTGHSSRWINSKIRERDLDENCTIFIKNLDMALDRIPPSNDIKLFHMTDNLWEGMVKGGIIKVPNYLSTSIEDYENSNVVLRINTSLQNSKARDILLISNNKDEKEHLFLRESSFKVLGIDEIGKLTYVDLVEYTSSTLNNY